MQILGKVVHPPNVIPQGSDDHPRETHIATDLMGFLQLSPETTGFDTAEAVVKVAMLVWNPNTLAWERYTGSGGGAASPEAKLTKKIDQASTTTLYVGEAPPGTGQSSMAWRLQRITFNAVGFPTEIAWAGGAGFNQAWIDRAILSYQ